MSERKCIPYSYPLPIIYTPSERLIEVDDLFTRPLFVWEGKVLFHNLTRVGTKLKLTCTQNYRTHPTTTGPRIGCFWVIPA